MKRETALVVVIVVVCLMLIAGVYASGTRFLRSAAWSGDIGESVTFVEIYGIPVD